MEQDEGDESESKQQQSETAGSTLLPSPIANAVSLVTRSGSLYLRLGTFIGGLALDGARITTLTGLELSRAVIEGILNRAGRDVAIRSTGELGKAEAEGILERSIATLHSTITNVSFAASTGFHFSAAALNSAGDISQQLLSTLDGILGSTDSSRAIASIITLIRREFQNPATGREGEKVGVADLLMGICGLALLQRWCQENVAKEEREKWTEEVVWDMVILDNGRRVDVAGSSGAIGPLPKTGDEMDSEDDLPEITLKQRIMASLPPDASVSIKTEETTTKTITVDVTGSQAPSFSPPPGVEIIEETPINTEDQMLQTGSGKKQSIDTLPTYRIVYRVIRNRLRTTVPDISSGNQLEVVSNDTEMPMLEDIHQSPKFTLSPMPSPEIEAPPLPPRKDSIQPRITPLPLVDNNQNPRVLSDNTANQKRSRKPFVASTSTRGSEIPTPRKTVRQSPPTKKSEKLVTKPSEKKSSFRQALRKGSTTTLTSLLSKETSEPSTPKLAPSSAASKPRAPPKQDTTFTALRDAPEAPQRGNPNYFSSRDLGAEFVEIPRSSSRSSFYPIHDKRRDSMVSQTDTYSIHSAEIRPGSPTTFRTHLKAQSSLLRARSEKSIANQPESPNHHRRSQSYVPSIYTLKTNDSSTSLVLGRLRRKGALEDSRSVEELSNTGFVTGMFPQHHIVRNMTRYVRFASASYGASFLRVMGIASSAAAAREIDTSHHHEHHSFSTHTQLPTSTILLSSFVDPQGGTDSSGNTNTGVPMVHFVSLDHESKAVILTCRGTLGFEDVLTDMTCDYDELTYRGSSYRVHKGIHASARRLLDGGGGRVMMTIAAALEEFQDYGLVMCGHSLGGGVTALLAILISEPSLDPNSSAFFTADYSPQLLLPSSPGEGQSTSIISLPPGRPVHVYAYGPPASISPSLRLVTRGLITTVVNNQDLVPYLSLGVLHDLQAVALAFKTDDSGAKSEVRKRLWEGITGTFSDKWYNNQSSEMGNTSDDEWAFSALKTLRANMLSSKLVPPGEVFVVETVPVLQREAFVKDESRGLGRPATRCVLKYIRDVEKKFGEVKFGGSMLLDHSPGRYEWSLAALGRGVLK